MKKFSWLIFLLVGNISHAQSIMGIEPAIKFGRIYKHTKNFQPDILRSSFSFDLNLAWQTTGAQEWQRFHHYPWLGVNVGFAEFGNKDVLGNSFYLVPNINLPMVTGKKLQLYFRMGVGAAYLTKHYDKISNPTNDVIASSINNCTSFSIRGRYKMNDRLRIFLGSSFTHFSTGDVKLPNLGINIPTIDAGICYTFKPVDEKTFNRDSIGLKNKRILVGLKVGLGYNEFGTPNGPTYPIYIGSASVGKLLGRWNKVSVGAQTDFNEASYYFLVNQEIDTGMQKQSSTALSVLLEDEMQFGNFALTMQTAYYLKRTILSGNHFYQKLGAQYYFLNFGRNKHIRMSWGVYLTTHFFNADYVSTEIGFVF